MHDMNPHPLTDGEWREIWAMREVVEMWGYTPDDDDQEARLAEWKSAVYACRFNFVSGSPGYCGDLYFLIGDALTGDPPIMLVRVDGKLVLDTPEQ